MEYFPGGDLTMRIQGGINSIGALKILVQIAKALDAVHAAGVVHRDLKPANIMFRESGRLAILDFGLARELDATSTLTQRGMVMATPLYMSPEQCLGHPHDPRGDLYSVGCILYEMLTGDTPFQGDNPSALAYQHVNAPVPRLPARLAGYQPLIERLMAKNPAERFQTAREMREALAPLHAEVGAGDGLRALGGSASPTALQPGARAPRDSATEGSGSTLQEATPSAARSTADAGRRRRPRELWLGAVLTLGLAGVGLVWLTRDRRTEATGGAATPATSPRAVQAVTTPPEIAAPTPEALAPGAMERRTPLSRRAVPVAPAPGPSQPAASPTSPTGRLALLVVPWAEVSVDGRSLGTTPLRPFDLAAGRHTVVLTHPAYEPVRRQLVIVAGETTTLEVDLGDVGFPKAR
jgi:serine/threonine-protein kinase PpkA